MTLVCNQNSNLHGKSSLLDFIDSISQMDDIQDVSARTVGGKVDLLAPRGGGRPTTPIPVGYGPH